MRGRERERERQRERERERETERERERDRERERVRERERANTKVSFVKSCQNRSKTKKIDSKSTEADFGTKHFRIFGTIEKLNRTEIPEKKFRFLSIETEKS